MTDISNLTNLRRRVNRARNFPMNTCGASRHVHLMADALASGKKYWPFDDEPKHCAESLFSVLESLFKARIKMAKMAKAGRGGWGK